MSDEWKTGAMWTSGLLEEIPAAQWRGLLATRHPHKSLFLLYQRDNTLPATWSNLTLQRAMSDAKRMYKSGEDSCICIAVDMQPHTLEIRCCEAIQLTLVYRVVDAKKVFDFADILDELQQRCRACLHFLIENEQYIKIAQDVGRQDHRGLPYIYVTQKSIEEKIDHLDVSDLGMLIEQCTAAVQETASDSSAATPLATRVWALLPGAAHPVRRAVFYGLVCVFLAVSVLYVVYDTDSESGREPRPAAPVPAQTLPPVPTQPAEHKPQIAVHTTDPNMPQTFIMAATHPVPYENMVKIGQFWIDKMEVSIQDFQKFAPTYEIPYGFTEDMPVVNVTWAEANSFAKAQHKRLCSLQEWLEALGEAPQMAPAHIRGRVTDVPRKASDAQEITSRGLVNMLGNVSEWLASPNESAQFIGGFWYADHAVLDTLRTVQSLATKHNAHRHIGFRCCKD